MMVYALEALVPLDLDDPFSDRWREIKVIEVDEDDADAIGDAVIEIKNRAEVARWFYRNVRITRRPVPSSESADSEGQ